MNAQMLAYLRRLMMQRPDMARALIAQYPQLAAGMLTPPPKFSPVRSAPNALTTPGNMVTGPDVAPVQAPVTIDEPIAPDDERKKATKKDTQP